MIFKLLVKDWGVYRNGHPARTSGWVADVTIKQLEDFCDRSEGDYITVFEPDGRWVRFKSTEFSWIAEDREWVK